MSRFGTGEHFRYYYSNSINQEFGEEKAPAFTLFPALSGCDATSQLSGKGKK